MKALAAIVQSETEWREVVFDSKKLREAVLSALEDCPRRRPFESNWQAIVGQDVLRECLLRPVEIDWSWFYTQTTILGFQVQLVGWAQGATAIPKLIS